VENVNPLATAGVRQKDVFAPQSGQRACTWQHDLFRPWETAKMHGIIVEDHVLVHLVDPQQGIDKTQDIGSRPALG
jgi:hypothetical protein